MAVTTDDLSAPLGQTPVRRRRFRFPLSPTQMLAIALGLFLCIFAGVALFNDNPLGGEPIARVALPAGPEPVATSTSPGADIATSAAPAKAPAAAPETQAPPPGARTVTIIDGSSGQRQSVVLGAGGEAASEKVGSVPAIAGGINPKLLESSRYGMIPVAADGLKPFSAYAMASDTDRARAAKMPSVAIVVTGLGVGAAKTADAIMKLPGAVTLAFTPYGSDPAKLVERARAQRHEVLLQVPMEPFDYPDNDPGPQTLLASLSPEQNLDRLQWHLSRIQGYVGIANFMGARFTVNDNALQPILREAARRGLGYFDDGSSPRSVAGTLADAQAMPFGKADGAIDAVPTAAEIDRALARLEGVARERGVAIGTASALPVSIERIAAWAKAAESRGILLVPLTIAMGKTKSG